MGARWKRRIRLAGLSAAVLIALAVALVQIGAISDWLAAKQAQLKFNWVYTKGTDLFSPEPSTFLLDCVEGFPAGEALDVAMGEGRNAIALAERGWKVTGFDVSDKGLEIARSRAVQNGLEILAVQTTCDSFDYGRNRWDLVALIYTPMAFHDPELMKRLKESLKPGGLVVIETFLEWSPDSGAPRVDGLTGPGELRTIFSDFDILDDREFKGVSDWFSRETQLIQFCARKE